ncbi:MAG TPA: potassium/proton antiporter [Candidatus Gemmiger faecigallinarum]|nr:potassium/proton antiporter [Candidatus Gemmiger faecigallinarum]
MLASFLLFLAVVIFACVAFNRLSIRLGVPALLAFLFLGMLFGSDGIARIPFDDYAFADQISTVALLFIMFYGGFGTNWRAAKPVAVQSIVLSSLGTILTAVLTGLFCHFVLGMALLEGLLCGAVLGSTDAASVFSILRARKLALKENTDSMLEVESGSNDPFAYMLTAVLLTAMESGITPGAVIGLLAAQLGFGLAFGFGVGLAALWLFKRLKFGSSGFDTLFVVAVALLSYAAPAMLGGNGFLSVYITGILLGNGDIRNKQTLVPFFDGVTSMMQMVLFFLLGLLSFPSQMPAVILPAAAIALFMTLVGRPAAVFLLLAPFGGSIRQRLLVSFAGLRGAASIVFAVMTVISPVATDNDLFHIVFLIVLFSISLQGSLLPFAARKLRMIDESGNVMKTFTDYVDEAPVQFIQFAIPEGHAWCGQAVRQLTLPPGAILISLQRGETQLVPNGSTVLQAGDHLILCALENEGTPGISLTEKVLEADNPAAGTRLADIELSAGALVVLVRRGERYLIPNGDTVLQVGDHLVLNYTD